jgi:hypothetical protein
MPALCSRVHSSARQQPGEPVIESPSGMTRTGVAACAAGNDRAVMTTMTDAVSRPASAAWTDLLSTVDLLTSRVTVSASSSA